MSYKLNVYRAANIRPQTVEKFAVQLPGFSKSLFKVSQASLPFSSFEGEVIWYYGIPFYLPAGKKVPTEWSCVLDEDYTLSVISMISTLQRKIKTTSAYLGDIGIYILDETTGTAPLNACTLKYAWLKSVEPLNLNWANPTETVKFKFTFVFSSIHRTF